MLAVQQIKANIATDLHQYIVFVEEAPELKTMFAHHWCYNDSLIEYEQFGAKSNFGVNGLCLQLEGPTKEA